MEVYMEGIRLCKMCKKSINNMRSHATTCSSSCRGKLFRANKANYTLVQFRVPNDIYTDLVITAFKSKKGINQYLTDLVIKHE